MKEDCAFTDSAGRKWTFIVNAAAIARSREAVASAPDMRTGIIWTAASYLKRDIEKLADEEGVSADIALLHFFETMNEEENYQKMLAAMSAAIKAYKSARDN